MPHRGTKTPVVGRWGRRRGRRPPPARKARRREGPELVQLWGAEASARRLCRHTSDGVVVVLAVALASGGNKNEQQASCALCLNSLFAAVVIFGVGPGFCVMFVCVFSALLTTPLGRCQTC
jgi:hypothetical protein